MALPKKYLTYNSLLTGSAGVTDIDGAISGSVMILFVTLSREYNISMVTILTNDHISEKWINFSMFFSIVNKLTYQW